MNKHATYSDDWYTERLKPPTTKPRLVIDTDAANEIDDQFALAWALLSPDQLQVEAIYAEPFSFAHRRADYANAAPDIAPFNPPAVGMERSFEEILRVCSHLGQNPEGRVFRGSAGYLPAADQPLHSDAVEHLIALARAHPGPQPLYVLALGCVTNIASALLLAPDIINSVVVVWTSGYPSHAPQVNDSFNLEQDMHASRVLLDCGVPLVYLPGYHVGAQLRLSLPEMERYVQGRGAIGNYLHQLYTHNPLWPMLGTGLLEPYSWVIWDIITVAWLLQPDWVPSSLVRTPRLGDDKRWISDASRHLMREGYAVERDAIFADLLGKLPLT